MEYPVELVRLITRSDIPHEPLKAMQRPPVDLQKPAVAARMGINPFTKQQQMFAAKPARKVVKVRPLKALKDMAK